MSQDIKSNLTASKPGPSANVGQSAALNAAASSSDGTPVSTNPTDINHHHHQQQQQHHHHHQQHTQNPENIPHTSSSSTSSSNPINTNQPSNPNVTNTSNSSGTTDQQAQSGQLDNSTNNHNNNNPVDTNTSSLAPAPSSSTTSTTFKQTTTTISLSSSSIPNLITIAAQPGYLPPDQPESINPPEVEIAYSDLRTIGNGSFGVVFQATLQRPTQEQIAIKKVLQDKRFKNRELQIMRKLDHCNVVKLKYFFHTLGDRGSSEVYLHLVLEYIPETLYKIARTHSRTRQILPMISVKLYMYQLFRSLNYIHSMDICHRDIKPQNLLLNPETGVLKLCDFGSAKSLVSGEPNVAYICSRYYRAPELIFGATDYTTKIDIWSAGCVMAELILGETMFPGGNPVDQLVEIIKVLGTPTREQMKSMNPNYTEFRFPVIRARSWNRIFSGGKAPPEAAKLVSNLLEYTPSNRLSPLLACAHPFFDELRDNPTRRLPNGRQFPPLFDFTEEELKKAQHLAERLMPYPLLR